MVLQLPPQMQAQQAALPTSVAVSPSSRATTPQHATQPTQVLVMQGLSVSAPTAGIPVGSVLLSAAPQVQASPYGFSLSAFGATFNLLDAHWKMWPLDSK